MNEAFPWELDSVVWELTLRCCFRCAYCGSRAGEARENELTTAECLEVARQLSELGCRRVNLLGGEVFLRPDWREITAALTGKGIPTSVISALRADNVPLLPEFYETLKGYPIFAWQLQACSPMGNAGAGSLDTRFDPLEVLRFAASEAPKAPFTILVADNIGYFTPEETSIRGGQGLCFGGCSAGLTTLGIDSVGNVRGCESLYDERFIEGNLRQRSLREIWEDENAFRYNREFEPRLLTGKCARCELGEYCGGGCRSYNYFAGGKLYESPLCPRQPEEGAGL